jgi:hypothetical protein
MLLPEWVAQLQERVQHFTQAEQRPWPWRDHLKRPFSLGGKKKDEEKSGQQLRTERVEKFAASMRAESVEDLRDILSAMILSECAYKVSARVTPTCTYALRVKGLCVGSPY